MTDFSLEVKERNEKAAAIRKSGNIPAIVYGNDFKNTNISVSAKDFSRIFKEAGTSNLVELDLEGKKIKTLIHDWQPNPLTGNIDHIDFFKVNMKEKITTEIPLSFVGESLAVINLDGSLITPVDNVEVECLPGDLVSEIEVDISVLDAFDKDIRISDIKVPAGMTILNDPDEVVAMVQEPRSDEELEALDEEVVENIDAIEVENKGEEATEAATSEAEENKK